MAPWHKDMGPLAVMVGVGKADVATVVAAEVAEQPLLLVTVTVKLPAVVTLMDWVVAPLLHEYVPDGLAINVTEPPEQKVVGPFAVMEVAGRGLTVTVVAVEMPEQPFPLVTVAV